jgi:type 1 glutamine amidotransferase
MKKVLLVTAGVFHPTWFGRIALHKALKQLPNFSFTHISSLEKLPANLNYFSALVLHYHHKTISSQALEHLDQFVNNGGGILAVHAATASFKETRPYFKILGGRFVGHGAVGPFEAERVRADIFAGIADFVVRDELYIHELEPGIEIHFTAKHNGQDIPIVWTYYYGKGKVCYAVPGHTTSSMQNETYQRVLQQGLRWVCK